MGVRAIMMVMMPVVAAVSIMTAVAAIMTAMATMMTTMPAMMATVTAVATMSMPTSGGSGGNSTQAKGQHKSHSKQEAFHGQFSKSVGLGRDASEGVSSHRRHT